MKYHILIIVATLILFGGIIAGATFFGKKNMGVETTKKEAGNAIQNQEPALSLENIRPVSIERDHILGNPDAPIKIIEFSDTECPYCKQFHITINQIIADYGEQVAWVYRHFPLHQTHPRAIPESEATECAAELGGNSAFWKYLDRLFEVKPLDTTNFDYLQEIAEYANLNASDFQSCFASRKHAQRVADDYNDAVNTGGRGTPYTIIITADNKKTSFSGSLPYSSIKSLLDAEINKNTENDL